jgi:hypothetical protein
VILVIAVHGTKKKPRAYTSLPVRKGLPSFQIPLPTYISLFLLASISFHHPVPVNVKTRLISTGDYVLVDKDLEVVLDRIFEEKATASAGPLGWDKWGIRATGRFLTYYIETVAKFKPSVFNY